MIAIIGGTKTCFLTKRQQLFGGFKRMNRALFWHRKTVTQLPKEVRGWSTETIPWYFCSLHFCWVIGWFNVGQPTLRPSQAATSGPPRPKCSPQNRWGHGDLELYESRIAKMAFISYTWICLRHLEKKKKKTSPHDGLIWFNNSGK